MKIVKDNEIIDPPLNQTNRFIKFKNDWYEVVSLYIDIVNERINLKINTGYFDNDDFIITEKKRGIIENRNEDLINISENLMVNKDNTIKTTYKIHNYRQVIINDDDVNKITPIDDYTIQINQINSKFIDIKYRTKLNKTTDYNLFMQQYCTKRSLSNNIINCIKRLLNKGTIKWS